MVRSKRGADADSQRTKKSRTDDVDDVRLQEAVTSAVQAAIPSLLVQLKEAMTKSASPESDDIIDNTVEQSVQDHLKNLTGEKNGPNDLHNTYDQGLPLDHDISQKLRANILVHQYVDFDQLVKKQKETNNKSFSLEIKNDKLVVNNDVENTDVSNKAIGLWLSQFAVYATVLCRDQPDQAVGLFHYMDHIRSLKFLGYDWVKYDTSFRKLHASNPHMYPFAVDCLQLQMKCTLPVAQYNRQQQNSRSTAKATKTSSSQYPGSKHTYLSEPPFPFGTCWIFQRGNYCNGQCNWPNSHQCCFCSGDHPGQFCKSRNSQGNQQQSQQSANSQIGAGTSASASAKKPATPKPRAAASAATYPTM